MHSMSMQLYLITLTSVTTYQLWQFWVTLVKSLLHSCPTASAKPMSMPMRHFGRANVDRQRAVNQI